MIEDDSQELAPITLTPETRFTFRCHPGVPCFNACCAQTTIILSPYDVLRLKKHLQLPAAAFLERYTQRLTDDFSGLPLVVLQFQGEERVCPFLAPGGCQVYADRPATCRFYPVGVASGWSAAGYEETYVYIQEDLCLGFAESGVWTVSTWIAAQGLEPYLEPDRQWKSMMLQIGLRPNKPVSAKFKDHYFQTAYDLDRFRGYVFDTDFLKVFVVEPDLQRRLQADEEELLRFAFRYLTYMLRLGQTLTVRTARTCPGAACSQGEGI
ncbi:MAG: YkgJ family cysteine cluster protein [Desulfobacca sp.]|uniref:YkgJ family cysteine cluster protein n=1 Tax=Desulfobacca sp. TaxID=2067990 RepID=UPI00404B756C